MRSISAISRSSSTLRQILLAVTLYIRCVLSARFDLFALRVSYHDASAPSTSSAYVNALALRRLDVLADEVRANRHLALAASTSTANPTDSGRPRSESHRARHARCGPYRGRHRRARRAFFERKRDVTADQPRVAGRALFVIAIRRDIERAYRDLALPRHRAGDALRERRAAAHDADQHDIVAPPLRSAISIAMRLTERPTCALSSATLDAALIAAPKKNPGCKNSRVGKHTLSLSFLFAISVAD